MSNLFKFHELNEQGKAKAVKIALLFEDLLLQLESFCPSSSREFSLVKTKLEEACFFAKKSMAIMIENQKKDL